LKRLAPSLVADWARVAAQIQSSCRVVVKIGHASRAVTSAEFDQHGRFTVLINERCIGELLSDSRRSEDVFASPSTSEVSRMTEESQPHGGDAEIVRGVCDQ